MRLALGSIITALAAVATAYTQPNTSELPSGNAILKPGLNEQVPAGKPYTITWTPTTPGQVSLVLLRGPSTNVKPIATIVEDISNSGEYVWTPSTTLEPDVTHYGIMLVVEGTGQYQYSTQFGISNPDYQGGSSTSQVVTTTATVVPATTSTVAPETTDVTVVTTETTTECPVSASTATPTTAPASTSSVPVIHASPTSAVSPSSAAKPTTMQTLTSVVVVPSPPSVPSSGSGSGNPPSTPPAAPSTPSGPVFTGSGNRNALSMGAVAAAAFAVLAF